MHCVVVILTWRCQNLVDYFASFMKFYTIPSTNDDDDGDGGGGGSLRICDRLSKAHYTMSSWWCD